MNQKALKRCQELIGNQADVSLAVSRYLWLNEALNLENEPTNFIFSPISLNVVVSLIAAGSSGETLNQLLSYLNSNSIDKVNRLSSDLVSVVLTDASPNGGPKISLANSVWIAQGLPLKPAFQRLVEDLYNADSFHVDFLTKAEEVISEVNSWCEKKTNGLIKNVLPRGSVNEFTRLILANALYFKGEWSDKFDSSMTKVHDFHLLGRDSVKVPFMRSYKNQFISVFEGFKVLGLPYKRGYEERQFSMYIFLPDSKDGLQVLADKMGSKRDFLDRHLPHQKVAVGEFRLPKFKFSFGFEASEAVKKLGAPLAFEKGLTEMVDSFEDMFVSKMMHKAFIEVNEGGTEAAAVTVALAVGCSMYRPPSVDFVADHPFLFLIQEDTTGALLFFGQVVNPLLQE